MDLIPRIKKIKKKIHVMKLDDLFDDKEHEDEEDKEEVDIDENPRGFSITKISKDYGKNPYEEMNSKEEESMPESEDELYTDGTYADLYKQFQHIMNVLSDDKQKKNLFKY